MMEPILEVTLHHATLTAPQAVSARLQVGTTEERTKTSEITTTPKWEATFRFKVQDPTTQALRVLLYGPSRLSGLSEIGWYEVPLEPLVAERPTAVVGKLIVGAGSSATDTVTLTCTAHAFGQAASYVKPPSALSSALQKLGPVLTQAAPVFSAVGGATAVAAPPLARALTAAQVAWTKYNLEAFLPIILGLGMVFFGGSYMTTIAAVEAFRLSGWATTKHALDHVWKELIVAGLVVPLAEVAYADQQASQLLAQKTAALKLDAALAAIHPTVLEEGVKGLLQGILAVLGTIGTHFAQALTLGTSLAGMMYTLLGPHLIPIMKVVIPVKYAKWTPQVIKYAFTAGACIMAYLFIQIFTAFHSAIYGAHLVAHGVVAYLVKQKRLTPERASSPDVGAAVWAIGGLGFLWQLAIGFAPPFPLSVLLFPFTIVEELLTYLVNKEHQQQSWI